MQTTRLLLAGTLILAVMPAAAAPSLDQQVEGFRRQAARLGRAGKPAEALRVLTQARDAILQVERRQSGFTGPYAPGSPYRKALVALDREMLRRAQALRKRDPKASLAPLQKEMAARRDALSRKYVKGSGARFTSDPAAATARAHRALLGALLDEDTARYDQQRGDSRSAAGFRAHAWITRLRVYQSLRRADAASAAAQKLAALNSTDPETYHVLGQFHQARGDYARAAVLWQQVIALIESGKAQAPPASSRASASGPRNRLPEFYRELGFCYSKLGKSAEARNAMEKAAQIEATFKH
jgi:tetratricopeptide (TPR) repeat protein